MRHAADFEASRALQRVTVLGSTGSIGVSTLDVLARHPERFEVYALSAATQVDKLLQQCVQFKPRFAVMSSPAHAQILRERVRQEGLATQVLGGAAALEEIVAAPEVDMVMAAIVGAAGLAPSLAAARAGKRLLLANKESLVMGAHVFLAAVREGGARLLPIDSEHSAIFQALPEDSSTWGTRVDKIILTASGGPFRTRAASTLAAVTPEEACAHPNWVMGRKISVDSATLMNKALEVIEAHYLFGLPASDLQVVVHPQSIIHSMVQYRDGSVLAQLGTPDMRVPIAYGLSWPERIESGAARLDFASMSSMSFEAPDLGRFPGLQLAWDALAAPAGSTAVLNAANEIAVQAFLDRSIRFDHIHAVNAHCMERMASGLNSQSVQRLDDLLALDAEARHLAQAWVAQQRA
jgi:1-deoxy-D-xylulose-5-phosphate reductoisomerase